MKNETEMENEAETEMETEPHRETVTFETGFDSRCRVEAMKLLLNECVYECACVCVCASVRHLTLVSVSLLKLELAMMTMWTTHGANVDCRLD